MNKPPVDAMSEKKLIKKQKKKTRLNQVSSDCNSKDIRHGFLL
jgi:hypothetical protein